MGNKPVYKIVDGNGRVLVPKEIRDKAGIGYGDIVRLGIADGAISVKKVDLIEVGDQSVQAVEAFVRSAFKTMPDDTRFSLISELFSLTQQNREG